jgi:hypothetical protein
MLSLSHVFSVNYTPLINLESNISRLSLPNDPIPLHANPREQTLLYLRRLQSEMLRFMPQLSRSIQMLQEGRVNHLPDLVPILQGFSASNTGAIDVIQRYVALHQRMQQGGQQPHHHHHHHHHHNQGQQQGQQQPQQQPQNNNNQQLPISPNTQPPQNQSSQQNNQQPRPNPPINQTNGQNNMSNNPMGMLGGLLAPGSGFNFANLFAPQNRPQQQQQPQTQTQVQQPQQPQPQPQQAQQSTANNDR